jgi:hypothetical protein
MQRRQRETRGCDHGPDDGNPTHTIVLKVESPLNNSPHLNRGTRLCQGYIRPTLPQQRQTYRA